MILIVNMVLGPRPTAISLGLRVFHVAVAAKSIRFIHRLAYFLADYPFRPYFKL